MKGQGIRRQIMLITMSCFVLSIILISFDLFKEKQDDSVRRRIEIGFNSELNSRRLPIRLRGIICDCTHISEQPHIIVALFGSRNYPVLKQGHDLFRLRNNRELKSQPFEP